jgi:hypothetical protein
MTSTFVNQNGTKFDLNIYMSDLLHKLCPFWFPKATRLSAFKTKTDIDFLIRILYNYLRIQEVGSPDLLGFQRECPELIEEIKGDFIGFLAESMIIYEKDDYELIMKIINGAKPSKLIQTRMHKTA